MPLAVIGIASAMLLLGVAPMPYGYYSLMRFVVFCVFTWAFFTAHKKASENLKWVFALLAIVFNPLIPIHLNKELWAVIDLAAAGVLMASAKFLKR